MLPYPENHVKVCNELHTKISHMYYHRDMCKKFQTSKNDKVFDEIISDIEKLLDEVKHEIMIAIDESNKVRVEPWDFMKK